VQRIFATRTQDRDEPASWPDAAHGFLFQYHEEFAADVIAFLAEQG
jgi:hypothetical protein